jgi:hypothetical protein
MANRNFNRYQALEKEVKSLFAEVSIGASGAPTIVKGLGIRSISRNSAGDYTLTLSDKYTRLMDMHIMQSASSPQDLIFQLQGEDVDAAKTIEFVCLTAATPTDPSNGSKLYIHIQLKNSDSGE